MAAINFPTGATNGTTYTDDFGRLWTYNGSYWSIDSSGTIGVATESVTGLLSHVTQNIGGAKTFFANATFNGTIGVLSNTNSTSSTTGALIIVGGVGVSGNVNIGTGLSVSGNANIGTGLSVQSASTLVGPVSVLSNTNSTSSTTGALLVVGGIGVSGNLNVGTGLSVSGNANIGTGLSVQSASTLVGQVSILSNINSTSSTTGALLVVGGIGLSGRLTSGTGISILSTTDSTSTNTGAITVLGGIGVSANLYSRGVGLAQNASVSTYSSLLKANALAQSANYTYYLPQTAPSQGQSLQVTNVSGTDYTLSWVSQITKSITILSPQATDKVTLFAIPYAATITKLQAVVRGSASPAVHYALKYGTDRTSGTTVVAIGSTVSSTTTGNTVTTFDNSTPAADSYVWMEVVAITGTVDEYHLTVSYR